MSGHSIKTASTNSHVKLQCLITENQPRALTANLFGHSCSMLIPAGHCLLSYMPRFSSCRHVWTTPPPSHIDIDHQCWYLNWLPWIYQTCHFVSNKWNNKSWTCNQHSFSLYYHTHSSRRTCLLLYWYIYTYTDIDTFIPSSLLLYGDIYLHLWPTCN